MEPQEKRDYMGVRSLFSHPSLYSCSGVVMLWLTGWEKRCKTSLSGCREVLGSAVPPAGVPS